MRLEEKLQHIGNQALLSASAKKQMRRRVLQKVQTSIAAETVAFSKIGQELEKLTLNVQPTPRFKFHSRENLLDTLRLRFQRLGMGELFRQFWFSRRRLAMVVAFFVLFLGTLGYQASFPQASASKFNFVEEVSGPVYIIRDGVSFQAQVGDSIYEQDLIQTESDGTVSFVLIDDSRIALGPDSQMQLSQSWVDAQDSAFTSVRVDLIRGRAWSQVVNLLPAASFSLNAGEGQFSIERKALFDVLVYENETILRVFDDLVDFEVNQQGLVHKGTVGPPLSMKIDSQSDELTIEPIQELTALMQTDGWIQSNFKKSQNHRDDLQVQYQNQVQKKAGFLPDNPLYFLERGYEELQLLLNGEGSDKTLLLVEFAQNRFSEAIQLIREGNESDSQKALQDYQEILLFLSESSELEVQSFLDQNRKIIEGLNQQDTMKAIRTALDETSILVAEDDKGKNLVQLKTAADRLGLALELIKIDAYDLAEQSLLDYQVYFNEVLDRLSTLEIGQRQEVVLAILDQKVRDLHYLKLIQAELEEVDVDPLSISRDAKLEAQLLSLHHDTLFQLNSIVLNLKDRAVLHLTTFLEDTKADEDLQLEILGRLKKTVDPSIEVIKLINDLEGVYRDDREEVILLKEVRSSLEVESPVQDYFKQPIENNEAGLLDYKEASLKKLKTPDEQSKGE